MNYTLFYTVAAVLVAQLATMGTQTAEARGFGELGIHVSSNRSEVESGASKTASSVRRFHFDIATGWQSQIDETQWLSYGAVFNSQRGFEASADLSGYGLGAFIGWYNGPLSVRLDYILISEVKSNNGVIETQFREGSGFNLEIRYLHWFVNDENESKFAVGPSLGFTEMNFSKVRVGSLPETSASRKTESLTPGLRGVFNF